jgi:hypothetical protein
VFAPWRPVLSEVKDAIGVSVRARGTGELGEAEGRRGLLITSIDEALSADFVVAAGRGGRILELAESARAAAASDTELLEANVNDTREALQTEVGETYGNSDECHYVWVRDFDPDAGTSTSRSTGAATARSTPSPTRRPPTAPASCRARPSR